MSPQLLGQCEISAAPFLLCFRARKHNLWILWIMCGGWAESDVSLYSLAWLWLMVALRLPLVLLLPPPPRRGPQQTKLVDSINDIAFHNKEGTFASVGSDGHYVFWNKEKRKRLKQGTDQSDGLGTAITACDFTYAAAFCRAPTQHAGCQATCT